MVIGIFGLMKMRPRIAIGKANTKKKIFDNLRVQSILQTIYIILTLHKDHKDMVVLTERRNHMKRTYTVVFGALMLALSFPLVGSAQDRKADPDFIRARQLFFGATGYRLSDHSGHQRLRSSRPRYVSGGDDPFLPYGGVGGARWADQHLLSVSAAAR